MSDYSKYLNIKAPLLITGETGTGKSYLAREIFNQSSICKEKFLTVHLASLKEDLIESELFGHKKGAFTGALENKAGYLFEVGAGTLFLDEIGELSLEAQKKLLYLMEEKKFTPVGSSSALDFRGRIIMATNQDLKQLVSEKRFRADLFYRISTFHLQLKTLRDDPEVMLKTIKNIFGKLKELHFSPYAELTPAALDWLLTKEWRGNVRELRNALEFAVVMASRNQIGIEDFPKDTVLSGPLSQNFFAGFPEDFHQGLEHFERLFLEATLARHGGKVNETARRLGISKTTLIHKARKYGINTLKMRANASEMAA